MSNAPQFITHIRDLISENNIETAIKMLVEYFNGSIYDNEIQSLKNEYNKIKNLIRFGAINNKNASIHKNRICLALNNLINIIESDYNLNQNTQNYFDNITNNMERRNKRIYLTLIITGLGIVIGFLGELMPDGLKDTIEITVTHTFGISFLKFWIILTTLTVLVLLYFVWKEAVNNDDNEDNGNNNNSRNVTQHGENPIYIERNEGPINIH